MELFCTNIQLSKAKTFRYKTTQFLGTTKAGKSC